MAGTFTIDTATPAVTGAASDEVVIWQAGATKKISVGNLATVPVTGIAAAGTNQGTATLLTSYDNYISTATANSAFCVQIAAALMIVGCIIPIFVMNESGAAISVFGPSGVSIDGGAANGAIQLGVGTGVFLKVKSATALRTVR